MHTDLLGVRINFILWKEDICWCVTGKCKKKWQITGSPWRQASYTARSLWKLRENLRYIAQFSGTQKNWLRYDLFENEENKNVSCVISDCWILSSSETVKTTRLGLIYEGTGDLTFSEQFVCSFQGYVRSLLSSSTVCPLIYFLYSNSLLETTLLVL